MFLTVLCLLAFDSGKTDIIYYRNTEVYQPLAPDEILISPKGHVYILNFDEAYLSHYNEKGEKLDNIGAKGKGPGEFTYATQIFLRDGKLFVFDLLEEQFSIFSGDGEFERRIIAPGRQMRYAQIKGGWIYGDWDRFAMEDGASLFHADMEFKNTRKLMDLENRGEGEGMWVISMDGKRKAKYSALDTRPKLVSSLDGSKVYMTHPSKFLIYVIDENGKMTNCSRGDKSIPFDTEWAEEKLEASKSRNTRKMPKVETNYPEFFPAIRELIVDLEGNLVVDRWRGRPDDKNYPIALDESGSEKPMSLNWAVLARMAGATKDHVFVTVFDTEAEEAGLARVPLAKVEAFVAENPIEFDGDSGRSISISN